MRGHHIYKDIWTPVIGEELTVIPEETNEHDPHAIAVLKDEAIVGHVPHELSRILFFFMKRSRSSIVCEIKGRRKHSLGLEVPCVYKISGQWQCIKKLKKLLKEKD